MELSVEAVATRKHTDEKSCIATCTGGPVVRYKRDLRQEKMRAAESRASDSGTSTVDGIRHDCGLDACRPSGVRLPPDQDALQHTMSMYKRNRLTPNPYPVSSLCWNNNLELDREVLCHAPTSPWNVDLPPGRRQAHRSNANTGGRPVVTNTRSSRTTTSCSMKRTSHSTHTGDSAHHYTAGAKQPDSTLDTNEHTEKCFEAIARKYQKPSAPRNC